MRPASRQIVNATNTCPERHQPPGLHTLTANGTLQYCDRNTSWLTQTKMIFGTYTIPKAGVQVSGTFRSVNGTDLNAAFAANNAYLAANSNLGRPLAGNANNQQLQVLEPYTQYVDRRNELDLRVGKVVRSMLE